MGPIISYDIIIEDILIILYSGILGRRTGHHGQQYYGVELEGRILSKKNHQVLSVLVEEVSAIFSR